MDEIDAGCMNARDGCYLARLGVGDALCDAECVGGLAPYPLEDQLHALVVGALCVGVVPGDQFGLVVEVPGDSAGRPAQFRAPGSHLATANPSSVSLPRSIISGFPQPSSARTCSDIVTATQDYSTALTNSHQTHDLNYLEQRPKRLQNRSDNYASLMLGGLDLDPP